MLVLLYTLDEDGDLNNGVQITPEITSIVSAAAATINFDQTTAAFAADTNITGLVTSLNTAAVFTDAYRGNRALKSAANALKIFGRATSERKIVNTQNGVIKGFESTSTTWQFLGIPYATPPLGNLRWRAPQAPSNWNYREAVDWSDKCPQNPYLVSVMGEGGVSENCLYLNITVPKGAGSLPVMVWFHGGGFVMGSANNADSFNNAASLPTKEVILVTVGHRLGSFGYMAHSQLEAESLAETGHSTTGNYGQLDLIAALQWIQNNIEAFGGNKNNVTIFGESGGGGKVQSLMCSSLATGLFHKVICQSGTAVTTMAVLNGIPITTAEATGANLFSLLGVTTLAQARALSADTINNTDCNQFPDKANQSEWGPVVDNYYVTANMETSIKAGLVNDVPFLVGANNGDMVGIPEGLIEQMPWRSDYNTAAQYVYRFDRVPNGWMSIAPSGDPVLSWHGAELMYVFYYPGDVIMGFATGGVLDPNTGLSLIIGDLNANGTPGSAYTDPPTNTIVAMMDPVDIIISSGWNSVDNAISDNVMTMWTNFAKTGNPGTVTFTWPAYTTANDTFAIIDDSPSTATGLAGAF